MKVNQSCTRAAIATNGDTNTRKQIDIFNIFGEQFTKQFTITVDDTITGTCYDRFDFLPSTFGDNLLILTDMNILIYFIPIKNDGQVSELNSPKVVELPTIFENKFIPQYLRVSQYNPELYFGWIYEGFVIINFLDLSTDNPRILEIRRYQCPNGNFIWFDFANSHNIYLLSKESLWIQNLFEQSNELNLKDSIIKVDSINPKQKMFISASVSPSERSTIAILSMSENDKAVVSFHLVAGDQKNKTRSMEFKDETKPISIQWSSYGSSLYLNGRNTYELSNIFGTQLMVKEIN